jgi:hypothetical protein
MIRTWQNRTLPLSNLERERQPVVICCYFYDEPATLDTFYANIFRLVDEEQTGLEQVSDAMRRLLLYL